MIEEFNMDSKAWVWSA